MAPAARYWHHIFGLAAGQIAENRKKCKDDTRTTAARRKLGLLICRAYAWPANVMSGSMKKMPLPAVIPTFTTVVLIAAPA